MKKLLIILLLSGCSTFEEDCYRAGAIINETTYIYPTYTEKYEQKELIVKSCDFVGSENDLVIIPIRTDTLVNSNDTLIISNRFYRFLKQK